MNNLEFVVGVALISLISVVSSSAFIVLKSRVSSADGQQVVATSAQQPVAARTRVIVATQKATVVQRVPTQMAVAP
jgi:flagellar biogenesis protein FliO